ncbi:MAG: NADH-quinone oxidoreductase subunit J [Bacteroidota bacterium]
MTEVTFYFFGILTLASAIFILATKNVLHAALSLVVTLLSVAALYVFTNAEFLAVTQIMIYVGGIVVLIVFGVMLTNDVSGETIISGSVNRLSGTIITLAVLIMLIYSGQELNPGAAEVSNTASIENLGEHLMTTYLLPFEVAAVLLLVALVAATIIAGHDVKSKAS